jgi:competence protein ComFC
VLFARVCPVCGCDDGAPCRACIGKLLPAPLLPPPPGVDRCVALLAYEGAGRELVARVKYRNQRRALPGLARAAAAGIAPSEIDVVTWPPTTPSRRRRRGFDHAELLARRVAAELGRPCRRVLARPAGPAQTGLGAAARWAGPRFVARRPVAGRVLLVDDVVTTGATVSAAASVLRGAGAAAVTVLALARTPAKSHHAE